MRDITLGQYVIAKSPMHRLDPRIKLVSLVGVIIFTFVANNFLGLAVMALLVLAAMLLSGVRPGQYLRSLRGIVVLAVFTAILNVLFYGKGQVLWEWGIFHITTGGIRTAIFVLVRIMLLVLASSVLTFTTSPNQLTDGIESLLRPLEKLKVPVHEFAMMMTIAIRFIPTLIEETGRILSAQKARGADMESGGLIRRVKAVLPVVIPLFVSAFRRAFDLATAMEIRCYIGGTGRTRMRTLRLNLYDCTVLGLVMLCCAGVILLRILVTVAD